jgi:glutamine cyclotransferase
MIKKLYHGVIRRLGRLKGDWRKPVFERRTNVPVVRPVLLDTIPHDPEAFTQGLIYRDGCLYESTGLYGKSSLRQMSPDAKILHRLNIPEIFAEGISVLNDELVLLTWKENKAIRYSLPSLEQKGILKYTGEGWGLTNDDTDFIMSNGSGSLLIRDRHFRTIRKLRVKLDSKPVNGLNDLEYVKGRVFANTWRNNFILEIDLSSGNVLKIIDCSGLFDIEKPDSPDNMLNGIAYREDKGFFYLTGKQWKNIFLVKFN